MSYRSILKSGILAATLFTTISAEAQIAPGGMGGMGAPQQPAGEEKKEGVAEAAPKSPGLLPTTPALPAPKGRRKKWKLLEIDGYFRFRTDWFKNFHLGYIDRAKNGTNLGGAPFVRALGCYSATSGAPCENLSGANMRLRLEPTINIDEGTSIHIQADVLDNLMLGSTPSGTDIGSYTSGNLPPLGAFSDSQMAPQAGVNSDRDSITIKRAWAEVAVPLGVLKVGRMPNHWGMGMNHNGGGYDPIGGVYDTDADWGDNVDRVSFSAQIPGTPLRAMLATDWVSSGLSSNQSIFNRGREMRPFDLDDGDDGTSYVGVISKMDSPQEFKDTVDRGDLALNYGVYFEYRKQGWEYNLTDYQLGGLPDALNNYVPRDMTSYSPDLWAKLGYGKWTIEGEFAAQLGSIARLDDYGNTNSVDIRKFGGVLRVGWKGLEDKLTLGVEGGAASGDQWDNVPQGSTHIGYANLLGGANATRLTQFAFDREYKVDMILFRQLLGAVTNAGYVKPTLGYQVTKSIGFRVSNITSFAMKEVATPGNGRMYGTEFNGDIGYRSGGLYIGLTYGVLFPFSALSHPDAADGSNPLGWGTDPDYPSITNLGDSPGTAHTIQSKLILSF